MRAVLRLGDDEADVEVAVHDPAATVADLATAAGASPAAGLVIDGALVPAATPIHASGLRPGCEVAVPGSAPRGAGAARLEQELELLVIGGLAAGARHGLLRGTTFVGRDPGCSVTVPGRTTSNRHAELVVEAPDTVSLADAGSASGTWIDGRRIDAAQTLSPSAVVALGAALVRVAVPTWREPAVLGPCGFDGRRALHRPPPPVPVLPPAPVAPPAPDQVGTDSPRFGWAAAVVPLVGGLVLALLVDPRLAMFTLLGPAVLVGQWVEDHRRAGRRGTDAGVARRASLAAFAADLEAAGAIEARRRRALHPDPASLGAEVEALATGLWSRRPDHPGFAEVEVGSGPALTWRPPTTGPPHGPAAAVLAASRLPHGSAATASLGPGRHLGVAGARSASLAVARWVLLQLAAEHGPADLRIAVVCAPGRVDDWRWAAFLPHTVAPGAGDRRLLAVGRAAAGEVAAMLAADAIGTHVVVVVDGDGLLGGTGPEAVPVASPPATLTIGPSRRALPSRCTSVIELDGSDGWAQLTTAGGATEAVLATGVDQRLARSWARGLAGLADPEVVGGGAAPPATARLLDLLQLEEPTTGAILLRWSGGWGAATPIGSTGGPEGVCPVHLDLVTDGPHVLVAGTTGAGKSELLRSLVAGLAASSPPDRLVLLLVDYKGGAAFADAARLPHVLGVVTDLGPDEATRALCSLEAELRRREGVLSRLGLRELAAHPAHRPGPVSPGVEPLPRMVVVVDELAALAVELPSFLDDLVQLAARGRSLGVHLVLATQRPGSVVSAAVRTNCAVRCCLRVPDEADAVDVVGSPAPARLDRRQAGRAFLRRGAGDLIELQVALAGGSRPAGGPTVTVQPASFGPDPAARPVVDDAASSDLAALVEACCAAAAEAGIPPPQPLWLPVLPPTLAASGLPREQGDVVLGLVDDPGRQRRLPLGWRPEEGPLVALGSGPGPALALQAVTRVLASELDPGRLHVYGLDLAAQGLASLATLAHVGAIIRPGEHERLHRLVQRLADELATRQSAAAEAGGAEEAPPAPLVLVLIDGMAGLRAAFDGAGGVAALDALERVVVDGPALGLVTAVAADRLAAVPGSWGAAASRRLAFRGGDPMDLLALGAGRLDQSRWPAGRCLDLTSMLVAQVATGGWADPAERAAGDARRAAAPVATLGRHVALSVVLAACAATASPALLCLPLGIDGRGLGAAVARLRPGQPLLICGSPGTGRTTAMAALAASARAAGCEVLAADGGLAAHLADRAAAAGETPPLVVLADDADRLADPDGSLADLAAGRHPGVHLVAAVPPDAVRGAYGHWSAELRRAGAGLVLRPRSDLDADVLGIPLLPRWPVPLSAPGRGVLVVDGEPVPVQVATP